MKATTAIITVTLYLLAMTITGDFIGSTGLSAVLYLLSPLVIVGMIYIILKDTAKPYPELKKDEEWGYADANRDELGMF